MPELERILAPDGLVRVARPQVAHDLSALRDDNLFHGAAAFATNWLVQGKHGVLLCPVLSRASMSTSPHVTKGFTHSRTLKMTGAWLRSVYESSKMLKKPDKRNYSQAKSLPTDRIEVREGR